jgi:hypothetical protein
MVQLEHLKIEITTESCGRLVRITGVTAEENGPIYQINSPFSLFLAWWRERKR